MIQSNGTFHPHPQETAGVLDAWNDTIWAVMVEKAMVHKGRKIAFIFYNGTEIKVEA